MPTVTKSPERYAGKVVGSGHCVPFTREVTGLPPTSYWRQGVPALDAEPGCAIATFDPDGRYGNHTDGRSHAAILIEKTADGLRVWDQWIGQPVHERVIRNRKGAGHAVNDSSRYYVIELADV